MIYMNTPNFVYLFDFDGTLFGDNNWVSYWRNTYNVFKSRPYLKPDELSIRWYVLTARPLLDKPIVWLACSIWGMHPRKIYTIPTLTYGSNTNPCQFKLDFIFSILNNKHKDFKDKNYKVVYVDNDSILTNKMNESRSHNPHFVCVSTVQFLTQDTSTLVNS